MGDFSDLTDDCLINLLFSMAMDIDPEGGNSVKIPPPINVFHIGSLAFLNDERRDSPIIPHLGKGMPQHVLIDLLQTPCLSYHGYKATAYREDRSKRAVASLYPDEGL